MGVLETPRTFLGTPGDSANWDSALLHQPAPASPFSCAKEGVARSILLALEAGHAFLAIVFSQLHLQEPIFEGQESKKGIDWKGDEKNGGKGNNRNGGITRYREPGGTTS